MNRKSKRSENDSLVGVWKKLSSGDLEVINSIDLRTLLTGTLRQMRLTV